MFGCVKAYFIKNFEIDTIISVYTKKNILCTYFSNKFFFNILIFDNIFLFLLFMILETTLRKSVLQYYTVKNEKKLKIFLVWLHKSVIYKTNLKCIKKIFLFNLHIKRF